MLQRNCGAFAEMKQSLSSVSMKGSFYGVLGVSVSGLCSVKPDPTRPLLS